MLKNLPAMQETLIQSQSWKDALEKGMATIPVFLPGDSHGPTLGTQRVGHNWETNTMISAIITNNPNSLSELLFLLLKISLLNEFMPVPLWPRPPKVHPQDIPMDVVRDSLKLFGCDFFFFLDNKRYLKCIRCSVIGQYLNEYHIIVQKTIIQPIKVDMPLYHSVSKGSGTPMNTAALVTKTKRKQPKMDGSINKNGIYRQCMNIQHHSAFQRKSWHGPQCAWSLKTWCYMRPQAQNNKHCDSTHMRYLE